MSLNKHITENYIRLKGLARRITQDAVTGDDLLHTTLAVILTQNCPEPIPDGYIEEALRRQYRKPGSQYNRIYRALPAPPSQPITDATDDTSDLLTELSEEHRLIAQLTARGFTPKEIAVECQTEDSYIRSILRELRTHIHGRISDQHQDAATQVIYL
jgi:DNA-directed RNA polymerase specialized sigma24 family protein